ncbi:MAG: hypothetical protein WD823_02455 [Sulfuricaulis sp.]|uniref:hypothetical protein n=1 Tax=Sulfuricaulis sp. TaxID=2003553 RepID=UPI0034A27E4E
MEGIVGIANWLSGLSRGARIGLVVSAVWIIIIFTIAVSDATGYSRFKAETFFGIFFIIGVLPVMVGWGIRWIRKS